MTIPSSEIRAALALLERHMDERGVTFLRLEKTRDSWAAEAHSAGNASAGATHRTLAEAGANAIVLARRAHRCAVCGGEKPDTIRMSDGERLHSVCYQAAVKVDVALRRAK